MEWLTIDVGPMDKPISLVVAVLAVLAHLDPVRTRHGVESEVLWHVPASAVRKGCDDDDRQLGVEPPDAANQATNWRGRSNILITAATLPGGIGSLSDRETRSRPRCARAASQIDAVGAACAIRRRRSVPERRRLARLAAASRDRSTSAAWHTW